MPASLQPTPPSAAAASPAPDSASQGWILERSPRDAASSLRLFGLTSGERLRRALARAGCPARRVDDDALPPLAPGQRVVVLRADRVLDERLVEALVTAPDSFLAHASLGPLGAQVRAEDAAATVDALLGRGSPPARLRRSAPETLVSPYLAKLRKR